MITQKPFTPSQILKTSNDFQFIAFCEALSIDRQLVQI
jgi:hypothetical protein